MARQCIVGVRFSLSSPLRRVGESDSAIVDHRRAFCDQRIDAYIIVIPISRSIATSDQRHATPDEHDDAKGQQSAEDEDVLPKPPATETTLDLSFLAEE